MEEITQIVVPEVPKVIPNEQLYVYMPIANGDNPGMVSYNSDYFTITNGVLTIKHSAYGQLGVIEGTYQPDETITDFSKDILIYTNNGVIENIYLKQTIEDSTQYVAILDATGTIIDGLEALEQRVSSLEADVGDIKTTANDAKTIANDAKTIAQNALAAANGKQDPLVSGETIKTINGNSILGEGNLDTKELFYCDYGITTYDEIMDALNEGKLPVCEYGDDLYKYSYVARNINAIYEAYFTTLYITHSEFSAKFVKVRTGTDTWFNGYYDIQTYINGDNKISADFVNDASSNNKFVTASEKSQITTNKNDISTINLKIPSSASSSNKMTVRNEVVGSVDLSINSSTYVITLQCKDVDGNNLGSAKTIDLPLESVVVSGSYNDTTKKIVLTLQNGSTIEFSVADLVSGLQTEITSSNKLESDLVDDTNQLHKFMTAGEKTQISTNATNIAGLQISKQDALKTSTVSDGTIAKNIGFDSQGNIVKETPSSGDSATWGNITGTLSNQTDLYNALAGKQDTIDVSHKVSADYISNGTNNKVFTATEQTKLSGIESGAQVNTVTSVNTKTGAVVLDADDIGDTNTNNKFVSSTDISNWNGKQDAITSSNKLSADNVDDTSTTNKFVTANEKNTWNGKSVVIANPTLAGTESDLTGLEIDGTKYKVPTGGSAGVSSLGGATGAITLGTGLNIANNVLSASGLGALAIDTLWTNPNPSSNFVAQEVTPLNILDYELIMIVYAVSTTQQNELYNLILAKGCGYYASKWYWDSNINPKGMVNRFRNTTYKTDNNGYVKFFDAYWGLPGASADLNNGLMIPLYIYGLK